MKKNYLINLKNIASGCMILTMFLFCQVSLTAQGQFCGDPAGSLDVNGCGATTGAFSTGFIGGTLGDPCFHFGGSNSIWYEWTAPQDGVLRASSNNDPQLTDTQVSITVGGCPGACIGDDEDGGAAFTSICDAGVIGGTTYKIFWNDGWSNQSAEWDLSFTPYPFPTTALDEGDDNDGVNNDYVPIAGTPSSVLSGGTGAAPVYTINSDHNVNAGNAEYTCDCTGVNSLTGAPLTPVSAGPFASANFDITLEAKGTYTCTVTETPSNGCSAPNPQNSYNINILTPPPCTIDCSPIAGPYLAAIDDNFTWSGGGECEGTLGSIDQIPLPLLTGDCSEIAWVSDTGVSGTGADLNGASGFPLGISNIEYFLCGAPTGCIVTVELIDIEGPDFLSCPEDQVIRLAPGDCDVLYEFLVKAVDECSTTPIAGLNSGNCTEDPNDPTAVTFNGALAGGLVCQLFAAQEICYAVELDVQPLTNGNSPYTVTDLTVGYVSTNGSPLDVEIWGLTPGGTPTVAGLGAPLATFSFIPPVSFAITTETFNLPMPVVIPPGQNVFINICATSSAFFGGTILSQDQGTGTGCSTSMGGNRTFISGCNGLFQPFTNLAAAFPQFPWAPWVGIAGQIQLDCIPPVADPANEYESGDYLPVGDHDFSFTATDPAGNVSTCAWSVSVVEYDNPTESLTCNDDVNLSIDNNCEAMVTADMFLEGGPYACYLTGYEVYFSNDPNTNVNGTNVMLGIGDYTVTVVDVLTGNSCWGNFVVEDKTAPEIECVDITVNCLELAAQGAVVDPCGADAVAGANSLATIDYLGGNGGNAGGAVFFDITTNAGDITITALDMHTLGTAAAISVDVYVKDGTYNGFETNMGAWTLMDQGPGVALGAGVPSNVVLDNGVTLNGNSLYGICLVINGIGHSYTNGNGNNQQFSNADLTIDLGKGQNTPFVSGPFSPRVWNGEIYYTSLIPNDCTPPSDNCGEITLTRGEDVTIPQDCASGLTSVIFRQWIVSDEMGNTAECQQAIVVERVGLADISGDVDEIDEDGNIIGADPIAVGEIRLPAKVVRKLSCGDDTSPQGIYDLCSVYSADPFSTECAQSLGAIIQHNEAVMAAYPHYRTDVPYFDTNGDECGTAIYLVPIKNEICNLLFTYEDQVLPACGGDCKGNEKVIRTWTVLDWCAATTAQHVQIIKAADNEAPTFVTATAEMTATANPWGCMGTAVLPPVDLHDNCDSEIDLDIVSFTPGVIISNGIAYNLPKTMDEPVVIVYTATDCCGNEAIHVLEITVVDATPPVPITKENVVVGLTVGPNQTGDDEGIAKLFVGSIDNGSHDGDCGPVRVAIRRDDDIACGNYGTGHPPLGWNNNSTYFNFDGLPDSQQPNNHDQHDTDEGQYVKFCCEDLDQVDPISGVQFGIVEVWLGVWDDADMNGVPGSGMDNFNESWSNVRVEAKLDPVILVPPMAMIECTDDPTDPAVIAASLGYATAGGLCAAEAVEYTDVCNADLNNDGDFDDIVTVMNGLRVSETYNKACNYGPIVRTWCITGTDICKEQIIIVKEPARLFEGCVDNAQGGSILWPYEDASDNVFNTTGGNIGTAVGFENGVEINPTSPADATLGCILQGGNAGYAEVGKLCADDFDTDVSWIAENCSLIGHSLDSTIYYFEADACLKIIYDHTVIDWCQYDPNSGTNAGIWTWTVVGKIIDDTAPEITCPETCFAVQPECSTVVNLTATATDSLSPCPSEWIKWTVIVDMWGDQTGPLGGIADYEFSSYVPEDPSNGLWDDDNGNNIPDLRLGNGGAGAGADNLPNGINATSPGQELRITLPENTSGSKNDHTVVWKAYDGCGNVMSKTVTFQVIDKKPPTPYCINLSTALMQNGEVELWACDFDNGSFDNCTPQSWLRYSFGEDDLPIDSNPAYDPDSRCTSKTFTCEDLQNSAGGLLQLGMYVWDECDNVDFCLVNLRLVDNQGACGTVGSRAMIAGNVTTEDDRNVNDAEVMISNDLMSEYPAMEMTADGAYAFNDNPMSMDYDLTASKNDNYLNGVSTLDLVLIQKHILGLQALNSGYKMIAADVNNDSNVSSIDLIELRKLILGIYTELPANDSWRFADADKTVSVANPFPFAEVINVDQLDNDMMAENFVGIKIGDVNGSVELSLTGGTSTEARNSGKVTFVMEEQAFEAGQVFDIPVTAENFSEVSGYQFTLANSKVELVNVTAGVIDIATENFATINNSITTSWASKDAVTVENGVLFTLTVKALENGSISNAFVMSSNITNAEAYTGNDLGVTSVELRNGDSAGDFDLYQNEPNPFSDVTAIGFNMPATANATLSIYDVTGKVIKSYTAQYATGYNQVNVTKTELNSASGVLYYKLESGDYTMTKKMIIIE